MSGAAGAVAEDDVKRDFLMRGGGAVADGHAGATRRHCQHNLNFMGKKITLRGDSKDTTFINCGREGTTLTNIADRGLIFVSDEGRET